MKTKVDDILCDIIGDSKVNSTPAIVAEIAGEPLIYEGCDNSLNQEIINESRPFLLKLEEPAPIDDFIGEKLFMDNIAPVPPPPPTLPITQDLVDKINSYGKGDDSAKLNLKNVNPNYKVIITDAKDDFPFLLNKDMLDGVQKATAGMASPAEKSQAVFDYIQRNVRYGRSRRNVGYRNSEEVLREGEGVCGEMAYLYVTLARSIGLESNYVEVLVDNGGNKVFHACANVRLNGKSILVDPAYHTYDIYHHDYRILTDRQAVELFKLWRGG